MKIAMRPDLHGLGAAVAAPVQSAPARFNRIIGLTAMTSPGLARDSMKRTVSLLAFALLLVCACNDKNVEFRPVVGSGDQLVVSDAPMEPAFKTNLQQVLRFYNEAFTISDDGAILVPRSKWNDRDLMWNYTTKANDPTWLAEHPVSSPSP